MIRLTFALPIILTSMCTWLISPATGIDIDFYDDGELSLRAADAGVFEPEVPIFHNGVLINDEPHKVVEAFDRVPATFGFPLTFVDLHANTYLRATYQRPDGTTASLGTSVVGSASFRTPAGLQFIPTVERGAVVTGFGARYRSTIEGSFNNVADIVTTRRFEDPGLHRTTIDVTIDFNATQNIALNTQTQFVDNDRFRMGMISSMFSAPDAYDADLIRYEDAAGVIHNIPLSASTPRGTYILDAPVPAGNWIELVKSPGSTWFSDSPTIRLEILDRAELNLAVQGYLAGTTNPNDDSLNVWLEWLDAPNNVPAGTTFKVKYRITAFPPGIPPRLGDLNEDGTINPDDINLLFGQFAGTANPPFDIDGDYDADIDDVQRLVTTIIRTRMGDTNLDRQINEVDLAYLADGWKLPVDESRGWRKGDFTGDHFINEADLAYLADNWKLGPPAQALPEPASMTLLFFSWLASGRRR